jgi:hypothetical protein
MTEQEKTEQMREFDRLIEPKTLEQRVEELEAEVKRLRKWILEVEQKTWIL